MISENIGENDRMLVTMIYGLSNNYNNEYISLRKHCIIDDDTIIYGL